LGQRHFNAFLFQTSLNSLADGCTFPFPCVRIDQKMNFGGFVAPVGRVRKDRGELRAMNALFLPSGRVRIKIERWSEPFVLLDHEPLTPFQRLKPSLGWFQPFMGSAYVVIHFAYTPSFLASQEKIPKQEVLNPGLLRRSWTKRGVKTITRSWSVPSSLQNEAGAK